MAHAQSEYDTAFGLLFVFVLVLFAWLHSNHKERNRQRPPSSQVSHQNENDYHRTNVDQLSSFSRNGPASRSAYDANFPPLGSDSRDSFLSSWHESHQRPATGTVIYVSKSGTGLKAIVEMRNPYGYLQLDDASRNIRFDPQSEPELFVSATITVMKSGYSSTHVLNSVINRVEEYSFFGGNRPPLAHRIVAVTKVSKNEIEVVGTPFKTPVKQTYVADPLNSVSEGDLAMGAFYPLSNGIIQHPMFHENLLCYSKDEKKPKYSMSGSDSVYVLDSVRPLTENELKNVSAWTQESAVFETIEQARLYVRDPCVAMLRLERHLENESARNNAVKVAVEHHLDNRVCPPKSVLTADLSKKQTMKCIEEMKGRNSKNKWLIGSQLSMTHPDFDTMTATVTLEKIEKTAEGCHVVFSVAKQSEKLFGLVRRTNHTITKTYHANIGPMLDNSDTEATAIIKNFDHFFEGLYPLSAGFHGARFAPMKKDVFVVNGKSLDESQLIAMRTAQTQPGFTCIAAPPGSGKTFLIAALVAARMESDSSDNCRVVISATTNVAVTNALDKIHEEYPMIPVSRDFTKKAMINISEKSRRVALQSQASKAQDFVDLQTNVKLEEAIVRHKNSRATFDASVDSLPTGLVRLDRLEKSGKGVRNEFVKAYDPFVMGSTVALILRERRNATATHLILDEASQLSPATALALYCAMPALTHVTLLGDSRQLGPHSWLSPTCMCFRAFGQKTENIDPKTGKQVYRLTGELQRMQQKEGPAKCLLNKIYRCHPRIVDLWLRPIYGPSLTSGTLARDRDIAQRHSLPVAQDGSPCLLVDLKRSNGETGTNEMELEVALRLIYRIKASGVSPDKVAVVCHHKKQLAALEHRLKGTGSNGPQRTLVTVNTVDSFQGKEAEVIIVLITKTTRDYDIQRVRNALQFVSDPNRATVVVSRAQHAMYVLGDFQQLFKTPFWSQFHQPLANAGAMVDSDFNPISMTASYEKGPSTGNMISDGNRARLQHRGKKDATKYD